MDPESRLTIGTDYQSEYIISSWKSSDLELKVKNTLNNCLSNLEWSDNGHNKSHANRRFEYKGRLYSLIELAELAGTDVFLISRRLRKGWSVKNAVEVPRRNTNNPKQLLGGQV